MGWICSKCRTENEFSRIFCVACRFEPDEAFLKKEREAAQLEQETFQAARKKEEAALKRNFRTLWKASLSIQIATLVLLLGFCATTALTSNMFRSTQAQQILAGDFSSHAGLTALVARLPEGENRLKQSLAQVATAARGHATSLAGVRLPFDAQQIAEDLAASADALQSRGAALAQRLTQSISALTSADPQTH